MFYKKIFLLIYACFCFLLFKNSLRAKALLNTSQHIEKNIASFNLCTDQILLSLEPLFKEEKVTNLATDCSESALCKKVDFVSVIPKEKEDIWINPPHFILEGMWDMPFLSHMGEILHIPIYHLKNIETLEDIPQGIISIGYLIGRSQVAEKIKKAFNARLEKLKPHSFKRELSAAIIGVDDGALLKDMVGRAGFRLLSLPSNAQNEFLLKERPDLLIITFLGDEYSLKENYLFPPILQKYFSDVHHLKIKARLTLCGTVETLDVLESLIKAHDILSKGDNL